VPSGILLKSNEAGACAPSILFRDSESILLLIDILQSSISNFFTCASSVLP
jgi:hypothetical protein